MPATRNIVKSFKSDVAIKKRKCHANSSHEISPGEKHFSYEPIPGNRENICKICAPAILEKAEKHISKIRCEFKL